MNAQRIREQRCGLVGEALDLIDHLFLKKGISTLDNGRPREVITISKQICMDISASIIIIIMKDNGLLGFDQADSRSVS